MRDKRKRAEFELDLGLGNVFKGIGNLFDLLSKVAEEGEQEISQSKTFGGEGSGRDVQGVYGFSIRVGAGGKARVEPFGNIRATQQGPVVEDVREPMADVFDEGQTIHVICELPGVEADDVKVNVRGDVLEISAEGQRRKYRKELLLTSAVKPESLVTTYKNGIVEITLTKEPG